MADFDPDAYLQSKAGTNTPPPPAFDPDKYLQSKVGSTSTPDAPAKQPIVPDDVISTLKDARGLAEATDPIGLSIDTIKSAAGAIAGGYRGLWDLALGRSGEQAASDVKAVTDSPMLQPSKYVASPYHPINYVPEVLDAAGQKLANTAEGHPAIQTALRVAPAGLAMLAGLRAKGPVTAETADESGANASGFENDDQNPPSPPSAPQEPIDLEPTPSKPRAMDIPSEEATPAQQTAAVGERESILNRVGLQSIRESALNGDSKDASTDFQMTKYDQPAGRTMAAQFEHEKDTLSGHAENIVSDTGGTLGLDEDSLANRGATIARPFDELRQLFKKRTDDLYSQAQARSDELSANGNPTALTNLPTVQQTLADPAFQNTLLAKDQGNFLKAVTSQLQNFAKNSPNGFTPAAAEQFRQWLNQTWSPANKWAIGQLVKGVDNDVMQSAGENVYASARAMNVIRSKTLDNPNGISDLFDTDPQNPINRQTSLEKIPDKLTRLSADQFQNVLDTLKGMPEELQDSAQAAIGEIKAHLGNKLLQAGSQTRSGAARNLWNSDAVNNVLKTNASKFRLAFGDDPEAMRNIRDLRDAGNTLKVDASYPGADAQAANAMKRGLLSRVIPGAARAGGAAAGSIFGGIGAGVGEAAGGFVGDKAGIGAAESAALKAVQKRIKKVKH